jgi:hypothetical protein
MKIGNKIFFVLCAVTILAGVIIYLEASAFQKKSKTTEGTVVNTSLSGYEIRYTSDDGINRVYRGNHGSSKGWHYHTGDRVTVFYRADNPENMRFSDGIKLGRNVTTIGVIMLLFNIFSVYSGWKKNRLERNFKATGRKLAARILKIDIDRGISVSKKNPFCIDCEWEDPVTGRKYTHTIRYIWKDPQILLNGRKTIDVYIDLENPAKYFMDVSFLGDAAK